MYVKKLPKGWNNHKEHGINIRLLGLILAPVRERYQPVLMFDAVGLHLADEVMQELAAASIWFSVIPARLTFLLQPLDTHGFAKYKRYLKRLFQDNATGITEANCAERMVLFVVDAIRVVLQGYRWNAVFEHNGLAGDQRNVSKHIKQNLDLETLPL